MIPKWQWIISFNNITGNGLKSPYLHKAWFNIFIFSFCFQHILFINVTFLNSLILWQTVSKMYLNIKSNMIYNVLNFIFKVLYLIVSKQQLLWFVFVLLKRNQWNMFWRLTLIYIMCNAQWQVGIDLNSQVHISQ